MDALGGRERGRVCGERVGRAEGGECDGAERARELRCKELAKGRRRERLRIEEAREVRLMTATMGEEHASSVTR